MPVTMAAGPAPTNSGPTISALAPAHQQAGAEGRVMSRRTVIAFEATPGGGRMCDVGHTGRERAAAGTLRA